MCVLEEYLITGVDAVADVIKRRAFLLLGSRRSCFGIAAMNHLISCSDNQG